MKFPRNVRRISFVMLGSVGILALAACGRSDPMADNSPTSTPSTLPSTSPSTSPSNTSSTAQSPSFNSGTSTATATSGVQTDQDITNQVNSSLMGQESLRSQVIDVETSSGEVRLSGMVDSQAQKDQAMMVARAVTGVRDVQDEMTLRP